MALTGLGLRGILPSAFLVLGFQAFATTARLGSMSLKCGSIGLAGRLFSENLRHGGSLGLRESLSLLLKGMAGLLSPMGLGGHGEAGVERSQLRCVFSVAFIGTRPSIWPSCSTSGWVGSCEASRTKHSGIWAVLGLCRRKGSQESPLVH